MSHSLKVPTLLACAGALALSACYSGPRKPLFGNDEPEPQIGGKQQEMAKAPPRPHRQTSAEKLLQDLRLADRAQREELLRELLLRGDAAKADVEVALNEERVLVDHLEDLLAQLEGAPREDADARAITAPWAEPKYRLARDRYLSGNVYGAIQLIDAILVLEPDTELRPKLVRLRKACKERLLRESVLAARVETPLDLLLPDHPLRVTLHLKNLCEEPITLRTNDDLRFGLISLDYEELSPTGARTRSRTQRPVRLDDDEVVIEPGRTLTLPLKLPMPHKRLPDALVGRYHISGRLRAHTMLVGETPYPMFVPVFERDVAVLSREDKDLGKDPKAAFTEAVAAAQTGRMGDRREPARRAFVAAVVLAQREREQALELLAQALETSEEPLTQALCAGLARATGEPLNFSREEWLIWWKGRKSRPGQEDPREDPR